MVLTGKLPFNHKLNHAECNRLIQKADYMVINEENSPIYMKRMPIRKSKEMSVHGKEKMPTAFLWTSGAINITGAISKEEGDQVYDLVLKDLSKHCRRVFK